MTEVNKPAKLTTGRIRTILSRLQQLAWLELFEKWFGFGVKLLWVALFIAFSIYLRKEYKKDIFYIQDFKVPPAWIEQGYSGDVVKQAIIDNIDRLVNSIYLNDKSTKSVNEDGIELLSDFSVEGFNLKAVTRSLMAIFGKKNKHIGGYITLNDSTQIMAIQVSDQITQPVSIKKGEPAQNLIRKATLEVMKFKSPYMLIGYYMAKKDSIMIEKTYNYLLTRELACKESHFFLAEEGRDEFGLGTQLSYLRQHGLG